MVESWAVPPWNEFCGDVCPPRINDAVESGTVPDWNALCGEIFPPPINDMPTFEGGRELECNLEEEELMCTGLLVRVKLHILC